MRDWLKKYFIPHKKNGYHPYFLRKQGRLFALLVIFIVEAAFAASVFTFSRTDLLADIFPGALINEANNDRIKGDLVPLAVNPILVKAAKSKADDMASKGYFAHVSPEGKTPWYWLREAGYEFSYAGENLAVNFFDSQDLADAWMNSPLHRANIMNKNFTEIGIATSRGIYAGKETVFVVQFFGKPVNSPRMPRPPAQVSGSTEQEKFIYVENVSPEFENEVGPSVSSAEKQSLSTFEEIISSPKKTATGIQFIILALVVSSLIIAVFVEIKIQKAAPIMSGLLLIAIIGGVVYANHILSTIALIL